MMMMTDDDAPTIETISWNRMRVDNFFPLSIASLVVTSSFKIPRQLKQTIVRKGVFSEMFNWGAAQIKFADGDFNDAAPTWATLDAKLRDMETVEERSFADSFSFGRGRSNHKANIRLFDAPEGFEPDLVLYRDTAGWCPYCQKVWLQLEEKKIPYRVEKVNNFQKWSQCFGGKMHILWHTDCAGSNEMLWSEARQLHENQSIRRDSSCKYSWPHPDRIEVRSFPIHIFNCCD